MWNSWVLELSLNKILFDIFDILLIFDGLKLFFLITEGSFEIGTGILFSGNFSFHLLLNQIINFRLFYFLEGRRLLIYFLRFHLLDKAVLFLRLWLWWGFSRELLLFDWLYRLLLSLWFSLRWIKLFNLFLLLLFVLILLCLLMFWLLVLKLHGLYLLYIKILFLWAKEVIILSFFLQLL